MRKLLPVTAVLLLSSPAWAQETGEIFVNLADGQTGRVFLDGQDTGKDAPTMLKSIAVGNHMVQVKGDCLSAVAQVDVAAGRVARTEMTLESLGGFVEIQTTPDTASVTLDGQKLDGTGYFAVDAACGEHEITAAAEGFSSQTRSLNVEMGQAYKIELDLSEEGLGSLTVVIEPVTAKIYLDGHQVSVGPTTVDEVEAGDHRVEAFLDGYRPVEQQVTVASGETARVDITLEPVGAIPAPLPVEEPEPEPDPVADNTTDPTPTEDPAADEPKEKKKTGLRIAGGVVTAAGLGAVAGGVSFFNTSVSENEIAQSMQDSGDINGAQSYYDQNVVPNYQKAVGLWGVGAVGIIGGGVMLFVDDTPVVGFSGRF